MFKEISVIKGIIDWLGQKRAVIECVIERGSEEVQAEIKRFMVVMLSTKSLML